MKIFRKSATLLLRRELALHERSFASKGLGRKGSPKETVPVECLPVVSNKQLALRLNCR